MNEMDRVVKRYTEIVGEEPAGSWIQAIIEHFLDNTTMQYMVGYDVEGDDNTKAYLDRVRTYLSTMSINEDSKDTAAAMDLGNFEEQEATLEEQPEENLSAFQGKCWNCDGYGHSANQCPSKGGGKPGGTDAQAQGTEGGQGEPEVGPR